MTIKEMFKKIETYNEVTAYFGTRKAKIYYYDFPAGNSFETYADFVKYLKDNYLSEVVKEILKYDDFVFGENVCTITCELRFGDTVKFEIEVEPTLNKWTA